MEMLDRLLEEFDIHGDYVLAICEFDSNIVAVRCRNCMSVYYPDYNAAKRISSNCKITHNIGFEAIIFEKYGEKIEIIPCNDSWDGFQPIY